MSGVPRTPLGDDGYEISRLLVGGWQLSKGHHPGELDERALFEHLDALVESGRTTFDCADIYTGVEELFGRYRRRAPVPLEIHTKFVPDLDDLATLTRADVERVVDRSLARLGVERLDLVQFSWWDYDVPGYVEAAGWLAELREAGKLRHVGLTNFDAPRTREILEAGVPVVSTQVQYSLLDRRPEHGLAELARAHGVHLLAYGTLAGGLLSEDWLGVPRAEAELSNRSLVKYELVVRELGGWDAYQELLTLLAEAARRREVPLAALALRWVLDREGVAGAIVGVHRGGRAPLDPFAPRLELEPEEARALEAFLDVHPGPPGDCFGLERDPTGPHGSILWKNLHRRS